VLCAWSTFIVDVVVGRFSACRLSSYTTPPIDVVATVMLCHVVVFRVLFPVLSDRPFSPPSSSIHTHPTQPLPPRIGGRTSPIAHLRAEPRNTCLSCSAHTPMRQWSTTVTRPVAIGCLSPRKTVCLTSLWPVCRVRDFRVQALEARVRRSPSHKRP
jgi:hypothetical protein